MSFIARTAFQPRKWNNRNNDLQTITGLFGKGSGETFEAADCSAGFICTKGAGLPAGGHEMNAAADGKEEIFFCHPTDAQRLASGENLYAVGKKTLGLGIPAGRKDSFTKGIVGETYAFGPGNFSTLMDADKRYATIKDGLLVASASKPAAGTGYYFEMDTECGIDYFTEGNGNAFARYNLELRQTAPAAS